MLGSCLAVAVLAMLYEGLKVLREYIDAVSRCGCEMYVSDTDKHNHNKQYVMLMPTAYNIIH